MSKITKLKFSYLVMVVSFVSTLGVATAVNAQSAPTVATFIPPTVGTKWIVEITKDDGSKKTDTFEVLPDREPFRNRDVYRVSNGDLVDIFHLANGSWSARQVRDTGELRTSAFPHLGTYKWPMEVGRKWLASFKFENHKQGKSWDPVETHWEVVAFEEITVPAGSYNAFVLQSKPGPNNGTKVRTWFVPVLGIAVRREVERTSSHYLGATRTVTELTSYQKP
jgi:hypothetical protein